MRVLAVAALAALLATPAAHAAPTPEAQARQTVTMLVQTMQRQPDMGPIPIKGVVTCASFSVTPATYRAMGWIRPKPVWVKVGDGGHWLRRNGRLVRRPQMDPEACMYQANGWLIGPARIVQVRRHGRLVGVLVAVTRPRVLLAFVLEPVCSIPAQNCYRAAVMRVLPFPKPKPSKTAT